MDTVVVLASTAFWLYLNRSLIFDHSALRKPSKHQSATTMTPTPTAALPPKPVLAASLSSQSIPPETRAKDVAVNSLTPPKRFMTSTWHKNTSLWKLITVDKDIWRAILYDIMYTGPVPKKDGKVPVISVWAQHAWILPRALPPMVLQYISMQYFNYEWPLLLAFTIYSVWWIGFAKMLTIHLGNLVSKYGYLDGGVTRDHVPDTETSWTGFVIIMTMVVRPLFGTFIAYDQSELPHLSLWSPLKALVHVIILDFYFYWYHRVMHDFDFLWRFHRVHHLTKHPTYVMSGFAGAEQDVFDVVVIPVLAFLTFKIDFFTWWIASLYIFHTEAMGHSGLRAFVPTGLASTFLQPFGLELEIEDHDLHHRNGWRKSFNYGKQTKIWDTVFGTTKERIECVKENVAW